MGWMHRVGEHNGLVRPRGIHQFLVEVDERTRLAFIEAPGNDLRLAIHEAEAI